MVLSQDTKTDIDLSPEVRTRGHNFFCLLNFPDIAYQNKIYKEDSQKLTKIQWKYFYESLIRVKDLVKVRYLDGLALDQTLQANFQIKLHNLEEPIYHFFHKSKGNS